LPTTWSADVAPRAIWTGAISFGLVNIPVKLVPATSRKNVSFRELRAGDGSRVRRRRVAESDGEEVTNDQIVKGFELGDGRYVVLQPEELEALDPVKSRAIEIEDFIELRDIDPVRFDASYYLVPGPTAVKPYELLRRAMEETGKAGIARFVLRNREHLVVLRPLGDVLAVSTLLYHDEVIDPSGFDELPAGMELGERELTMATSLIGSMTVDWDPTRYTDEHRQQVLELIEAKAAGEEIVAAPAEDVRTGDVVDLVAALEASLEAAGRAGDSAASA
jgi:DNA end-binding protein Ku